MDADPDRSVHSALYLMQLQLQPHISDHNLAEGSWLRESPEPFLDEIAHWARYALLYDPTNYIVWDRVASKLTLLFVSLKICCLTAAVSYQMVLCKCSGVYIVVDHGFFSRRACWQWPHCLAGSLPSELVAVFCRTSCFLRQDAICLSFMGQVIRRDAYR